VHQNERWLNYTRRLKIRYGIEAYRNPGLNRWVTQERALKTPFINK